MRPILTALLLSVAAPALAATGEGEIIVPCGGPFSSFVQNMEQAAVQRGADPATARAFFANVRQDSATLAADQRQGVFTLPFTDFARRLISNARMQNGQANADRYAQTFQQVQSQFGVPEGILLAFWAFETDYGAVQGDFNTVNSLVTLGHDCRRPGLFQPQVLAALELYARGDLDPATTTGAWAGEIGQVQMLPEDILTNGVDGDGDGQVTLKTSAPDALMSGAKMLQDLGWRANEPWLQEITLPQGFPLDQSGLEVTKSGSEWAAMGVSPRSGGIAGPNLPASVILPQGQGGPAFLAYPNFSVLFEWNQSFTYVLTAAYFATRLEGAPVFNAGNPTPPLSDAEMRSLQTKLQSMGYDVGSVDGILGAGTRGAVRAEQARLGLPVDGWPTRQLLNAL
ncbi:Membrane-bound lytic murein transglycosylase B precursor [Rhodobacteraceae bacterium THAF1]|uniref:lytic murein transglycosylase n=1 Tax=Palleronia sp. THAF1 TaxID=2587842 RepID=UPI000F3DD8A6|nr:lytic murein transglycosylase [Palleronia sp. THAF1]QFU09641.1 Membrane-bound lytic murein transglycosylase B precursor [Palleronia sp. THAF1]VDC17458.1 Membrane-bound lytic murein transglycosylase B precursor [Rhodobacteraceae bacterium THAF1]